MRALAVLRGLILALSLATATSNSQAFAQESAFEAICLASAPTFETAEEASRSRGATPIEEVWLGPSPFTWLESPDRRGLWAIDTEKAKWQVGVYAGSYAGLAARSCFAQEHDVEGLEQRLRARFDLTPQGLPGNEILGTRFRAWSTEISDERATIIVSLEDPWAPKGSVATVVFTDDVR